MKLSSRHVTTGAIVCAMGAGLSSANAQKPSAQHAITQQGVPRPLWDARAAAAYLDARQGWWMTWPTASRDHETSCVSCHTALPYALARPALRTVLNEDEVSATERKMLDNVTKRVRLWKEVEPFYPDQTRGLPKTSESRGTEAILNAVILSTRDATAGKISDDGRLAFDNLWALQFRSGELAGAWAWLNFHYEPWESPDAAYFGAALAAVAVGTEPEAYAARAEIQPKLKPLSAYLQRGAAAQPLFNKAMVLWASGRLPGLLEHGRPPGNRRRIVERPTGGRRLEPVVAWPMETQRRNSVGHEERRLCDGSRGVRSSAGR